MSQVETYRGHRPSCFGCGHPLRPVYETETRREAVDRPLRVGDGDGYGSYTLGHPLSEADLTDPNSSEASAVHGAYWHEDKGRWYLRTTKETIIRRKWIGHFHGIGGYPERPYFHGPQCAQRFGISVIDAATKRMSDKKPLWEATLDVVEEQRT